jgi:hypothetical protein
MRATLVVGILCLCVAPNHGLLHKDSYLEGAVFRTIDIIGLTQCANECMLTAKCSGINYDAEHLVCEFVWSKPGVTPANLVQRLGRVYSDISIWTRVSI